MNQLPLNTLLMNMHMSVPLPMEAVPFARKPKSMAPSMSLSFSAFPMNSFTLRSLIILILSI